MPQKATVERIKREKSVIVYRRSTWAAFSGVRNNHTRRGGISYPDLAQTNTAAAHAPNTTSARHPCPCLRLPLARSCTPPLPLWLTADRTRPIWPTEENSSSVKACTHIQTEEEGESNRQIEYFENTSPTIIIRDISWLAKRSGVRN